MSGSTSEAFPLGPAPASGWRNVWSRSDARGRQNGTLLGLLLAVELAGIVFAPLGLVDTDSLQGFAALAAIGACLAPPTLLAFWAVFGSGGFVMRLPLTIWLAAAWAVTILFAVVQITPSTSAEVSAASGCWLLAFVLAQAPLWVIRWLRRWRFVSAPNLASPGRTEARGNQFTLRGLLAWTLAAALPLAAFRAILPAASFDVEKLSEFGWFMAIGASLVALAGLPIVPLAWILLAEGRRPILRLVLSIILLASLPGGVWLFVDLAGGPGFAETIPILAGTIANGVLVLAVIGACGYRLDRGRPDARQCGTAALGCLPVAFGDRLTAEGGCATSLVDAPLSTAYGTDRPYVLLSSMMERRIVARKSLSRTRFTVALAPLVGLAVAIVCVIPHQLRQWRQSAIAFEWGRSGVSVQFDDAGRIVGIDGLHPELVSDELVRGIADLKDCTFLRAPGGKIDDRRLALLSSLAELRVLDLSDCEITDVGLDHLAGFKNLQELDLTNTSVTDAGLLKLAALPKLSSLDVRLTAVTDAGLATLAKLPRLKRLDVSLTAVSVAAAKQFARPNSRVAVEYGASDLALSQWLSRRGRFVSPVAGGVAYAIAAHPRPLKRLHAHGSQPLPTGTATVTDAGLRLLAPITELEELDLHDTAVSDQGLSLLAKLTALKTLDVRGTKVTEQGVADLARSLPVCRIAR